MKFSPLKKDRKKRIRTVIQIIILNYILVIAIRALFVFSRYQPYNDKDQSIVTGENKGFIALSYLAVDRSGTQTMISTKRLNEHFEALSQNGFVTISQEDISQYYKEGKALPKKALFLMFEDGRRDTAVFSQKIMEEYNFLGTMLSYGDKFDDRDMKFLFPKDLLNLRKSSYWELGTNGYRLSYINVFDRYGHFLGELTPLEYSALNQYLDRDYDHYLMDFIRDDKGIPRETYSRMEARISRDYKLIKDIYTKEFGEVPGAYVLMHANTGSFGTNEKASSVNEQWIKKLFKINFNREGFSLNNRENNIYDLTRMQPQAYWYPNHLLMRISKDTGAKVKFMDGDLDRKKDWDIICGAPEFRDSVIALTSESEGRGIIRLKKSRDYQDISLSLNLTGNKLGSQRIYLRADEKLEEYISIGIRNNYLYIEENTAGMIKELIALDLNKHDGILPVSVEENIQEALETEYKAYMDKRSFYQAPTRMEPQNIIKRDGARTVEEGAKEYIRPIQINEAGNRRVEILLKGDGVTVLIDGRKAVGELKLSGVSKGYVYLESAWSVNGFSQRNTEDDVYDGVFENLVIRSTSGESKILYSNQLRGWELVKNLIKTSWDKVIDWFIKAL